MQGLLSLQSTNSGVLRLLYSSCGTWVYLLRGLWDLPRPEIKPMSPALAGGFLTTGSPEKPYFSFFLLEYNYFFCGGGSFPHSSVGKESACNAGDPALIPRLGRFPGEGNGNPLQYFWPENPHRQRSLAHYSPWGHRSQTQLSN